MGWLTQVASGLKEEKVRLLCWWFLQQQIGEEKPQALAQGWPVKGEVG